MTTMHRKGALVLSSLALLSSLSVPAAGWAEPRLDQQDRFLPFRPGFMGYDRVGGNLLSTRVFAAFGDTVTAVFPGLDTAPAGQHHERPDVKYRVRVTTSGAAPFGIIEVHGNLYEWDGDVTTPGEIFVGSVSEELDVDGGGTFTTSTYFDQITSITTAGLGTDVTLTVSWWDGHEQEMHVYTPILDITESECSPDHYLVYFNGQPAPPAWKPPTATCSAALIPSGAASRGMYFWLDPVWQDDAFFQFDATGHSPQPSTLADWLSDVPAGPTFFVDDLAMDPLLRPITIELERQSDLQIIDRARTLLWLAEDEYGAALVTDMQPETVNPGAFAQLSPSGLDELEPTHLATLPYPLRDPGTQPRLSAAAIQLHPQDSEAAEVNLADLPDVDYWTEKNPDDPQFAGHLAYRKIFDEAEDLQLAYEVALQGCNNLPPIAVPVCRTGLAATHCVKRDPRPGDFRVVVDEVEIYYDPARPLDALVVGDYRDLDLAFGDNQLLASFTLHDMQGWLEGVIDPAEVRIEWDTAALGSCFIKPAAQTLLDFLEDTEDREGWLTCPSLGFAAGSASLADPIPFDLVKTSERFDTPFAGVTPQLTLQDLEVSLGHGTCAESWIAPVIEDALLGWETATGDAIEQELIASPGQDEALDRLLSPFELGIERVSEPPVGTPPYIVHPLASYSLSAVIAKTSRDPIGPHSNAVDGLYLPYRTQSSATVGIPYDYWLCPYLGAQGCKGLRDTHEDRFLGGLDPDYQPFDVLLSLTTAHINQALWAQARRPDHLGSGADSATLSISPTAVMEKAIELGKKDLEIALAAVGSSFEIRYYQDAVPYAVATDVPPKLIYVIPNVVVELWTEGARGRDIRVAKLLVDFLDRDFNLQLRLGGAPSLAGAWRDPVVLSMTSEFLVDCYDAKSLVGSCDGQLHEVVGQLLTPVVVPKLMDMITMAPAPQLFDSGQESGEGRHLTNVRRLIMNQGVHLFGNLCDPQFIWCP